MRNRSLLLLLLLYSALAWVWSGYKYSGEQIVQKGLLWTAMGIGIVLAVLIAERVWLGYRNWRARHPRQAAVSAPAKILHEDDAALASLWQEARAKLAASPDYGMQGRNLNLAALPLFLIVGPTGSGKSTTLLHSGVDFQLLAGQTRADSSVAATRVANFYLSRNALFVEIGGRIWDGDAERWTSFLRGFTDHARGPWWRRFWKDQPQKPTVRGVILFEEISAFPEKADSAKVSRLARHRQERLQAISDVLGLAMPVYAIFAKADSVAFFDDFFLRLPEPESWQPLGTTLRAESGTSVMTADQATRRFTRAFNTIGSRLAERRILHLSRESDGSRKPGVYEFPREFRRARAAFIQFLSEVFRPNPLKMSPFLRGFYFTGIRMAEAAPVASPQSAWVSAASTTFGGGFKGDATTIFRPEATQIFRAGSTEVAQASAHSGRRPTWMFARQLFEEIIPFDRLPNRAFIAVNDRMERLRQSFAAALSGIAMLICLIWLQSWWSNRALISDSGSIASAAATLRRPPEGRIPLASLEQLELLRQQGARLEETPPMRMRWGLYAGDSIRQPIRAVYFENLNRLLLEDLNRFIVDKLAKLPAKPDSGDPFEPSYSQLATHLKMTTGSCQTNSTIVAGVLKSAAEESGAAGDGMHRELLNRQVDYYAAALKDGPPVPLQENTTAVVQARGYLSQIKSPQRLYLGMREVVEAKLKGTVRLGDTVPEYQQVLAGPGEMPQFFSPKGREMFEQEVKNPNRTAGSDACVLGAVRTTIDHPEMEREIRELYVENYKAEWKTFLSKFQVQRYAGSADAVKKLEVLSSQRSPILGLLAFTSNNTYFAPQAGGADMRETLTEKLKEAVSKKADPVAKKLEKLQQLDPKESPLQVTGSFQPVHAVVSPGSDMWVSESNKPYLNALADFRLSLQNIARSSSPTPDPALHQAALAARDKALETVRQLAQSFEPVGTDGIDAEVRDLLEQPIRNGSSFIIVNPEKAVEGKLNGQLAGLCTLMRPVLAKYPFARNATAEASLEELSRLFSPDSGAVWKYQQDSLGEFTLRQEGRWIRKPDVQQPKIADSVIELLNRAQQISSAFYGAGSAQSGLQYTLRPVGGSIADQISLEFNFDGRPVTYAKGNVLQKSFHWPPPSGHRAVAKVVTSGFNYPFASGAGIWGVFRVFADAEPRALDEKNVEWKYNRVAGGQPAPMDPPVRMQFVELPGGIDLFNPAFFGSLQCPGRAVQ